MYLFLISYIFYNEEGIPIISSFSTLAKDEIDAKTKLLNKLSFSCIEITSIQKNE